MTVVNTATGVIEVHVVADEDGGEARGIHVDQDDSLITNNGEIIATATSNGYAAHATGIQNSGENGTVVNNGSILADISLDTDYHWWINGVRATGVQMDKLGNEGTTLVRNTSMDSIVAQAVINAPDAFLAGNSGAVGIEIGDGFTWLNDDLTEQEKVSRIQNSGLIDVSSDITVNMVKDNAGAIAVKVGKADADLGWAADGSAVSSILDITNSGTMKADANIQANIISGDVGAFGILGGKTDTDNFSDDPLSSSEATTTVTNSGLIDVDANLVANGHIGNGEAGAFGVKFDQTEASSCEGGIATATTTITNTARGVINVFGDISGNNYVDDSVGVYGVHLGHTQYCGDNALATTLVQNAGAIRIGGTIQADDCGDSVGFYGIQAGQGYNIWADEPGTYQVQLINTGTIAVNGTLATDDHGPFGNLRGAFGISSGSALVVNTGTIDVTGTFQGANASWNDGAYGVRTGGGFATVVNTGTIAATAIDENEEAGIQRAAGIWTSWNFNAIYQSGIVTATGTRACSVIMGSQFNNGDHNMLFIMNGANMTGDILNAAGYGAPNIIFGMVRQADGTADFGTYANAWDFAANFAANFANVPVDPNFNFVFEDDIRGYNDGWNAAFLGGSTHLRGNNDFESVLIGPEATVYANFAAPESIGLFGTLAPGNSIGWVETSDFYAAPGSTLQLEFTGTEIDEIRINDGGSADLAEGARLHFIPLDLFDDTRTFTFIQLGTGATLDNDILQEDMLISPLFSVIPGEDPGTVDITRENDLSDFAPRGAAGLARMLDRQVGNPALAPIFEVLMADSDAKSLGADLLALMGQSILGVPDAFAGASTDYLGVLGNRTLASREGMDEAWQFWVGGLYGEGEQDGSGYEWDTMGALVGADKMFGDFLLGLSLGYGETDYNEENNEAESDIESTHFGLYARYDFEGFFLTGAASVAWGEADNERHVLGLTARSDTDLLSIFGQLGIGMDLELNQPCGLVLTPLALLRYGYISQDGYTETGAGAFNLIVDDYDRTILEAVLGLTASMEFADLKVGASAFWEEELTDADVDFDAAFAAAPGAMCRAEGVEPEDGCFVGGLNLDYSFTERVGMFVDYQAKLGSSLTAQTVTVGVRIALGGE
jgi:hypothetical protein